MECQGIGDFWLGVGLALLGWGPVVLKGMDRIHFSESIHLNSPQDPIVFEIVSTP